jgi:hypothetical protein
MPKAVLQNNSVSIIKTPGNVPNQVGASFCFSILLSRNSFFSILFYVREHSNTQDVEQKYD